MDEKDTAKFVSSHILLEMAKDEYTKERERATALDNKASFFITVLVAVVTIFIPIIPFDKIITVYSNGACWRKCLMSVSLVGLVVAFFLLKDAFAKLYDAYKLTNYKRPSLGAIPESQFHTANEDQVYKGLCDHYKTVVDDNIEVNNKKCDSITDGIKQSGKGFLVLTVAAICLIVVIGG